MQRTPPSHELGGGIGPRPRARTLGPFSGITYPLRGARIVYREHPRLARYWLPPLILTVCAMAFAIYLALDRRDELLAMVWPMQPGADVGVLLRAAHWAVGALVTLFALGVALVGSVLVSQVMCAPFHDALSQAVEALSSDRPMPPTTLATVVRDAVRSLQLAIVKLAAFVALMVPLWLISVAVPVVGPAFYAAAGFLVTIALLALDHVDWAASRHGLTVSQRFALLRAHPLAMLGFGACTWAMLFVPIVNALFIPAAVAGGTLLFLDLHAVSSQHEATEQAR